MSAHRRNVRSRLTKFVCRIGRFRNHCTQLMAGRLVFECAELFVGHGQLGARGTQTRRRLFETPVHEPTSDVRRISGRVFLGFSRHIEFPFRW